MNTKAIPDGYDALIPYLCVRDAARAIEFYKNLFGATEVHRMTWPGGTLIMHAELKIRHHALMLGDENPQFHFLSPLSLNGPSPVGLMFYVPDVDAVFQKAISLGATAAMPPADMFWGDRYGKFIDPFGHVWAVATHVKDMTPEEMQRGAAEACQSQATRVSQK